MRKKSILLLLILTLLLLVGMVGVLISMEEIDKQSEENTIECLATVEKVQIANNNQDVYIEIYTKEYHAYLYISTNIAKYIDGHDIHALQEGDRIAFRIESQKRELLNNAEFVDIVSLKTTMANILSIDEYNEYMAHSADSARTAGVVCVIFLLCLLIYCVYKLKRKHVKGRNGD